MRLVIRDMVTFDLMQPAAFDTRYQTGSPKYGFIDPEPVLEAANEAHKNTVTAVGLGSTKGPGARADTTIPSNST